MIEAAANQDSFYDKNWRASQNYLMDLYLTEANCTTPECRAKAYERSSNDATGRLDCDINLGNSAWLWFMGKLFGKHVNAPATSLVFYICSSNRPLYCYLQFLRLSGMEMYVSNFFASRLSKRFIPGSLTL